MNRQDAKNAKKNCRNEKETEALLSSWRPLRLCGFLFQQPARPSGGIVLELTVIFTLFETSYP
jgi:hypothetical protein